MADQVIDLKAARAKNLPEGIDRSTDSMTINGGIGDGVNDGGPAYCIDTVSEGKENE